MEPVTAAILAGGMLGSAGLSSAGGKKGGGGPSRPAAPSGAEQDQALMLRRLFQETSPLRRGILSQGMRTLFPNAKFTAAPTGPRMISANDLRAIYARTDPSKADDVDAIWKALGNPANIPLDQLTSFTLPKRFSARSNAAWAKTVEELGQDQGTTPTDPGYDIEGSPLFSTSATAAERQALESQYGQAGRQLIQTSGARGGQLLKAQMLMGQDRARAMTDLTSGAEQRGVNQALATLTGTTLPDANAVIGGQGNLASIGASNAQSLAARDAYARQQAAERQAGLGRSLGSLAADYAKKASKGKSTASLGAGGFGGA